MIFVFIIYLIIVFVLPIYFSRKSKIQDDFILGGCKTPYFALALSERAKEVIALILGGAGTAIAYKMYFTKATGISERLSSYIFAFAMAIIFSYIFPSKKNREMSQIFNH
jgi:Na+/proline symporter